MSLPHVLPMWGNRTTSCQCHPSLGTHPPVHCKVNLQGGTGGLLARALQSELPVCQRHLRRRAGVELDAVEFAGELGGNVGGSRCAVRADAAAGASIISVQAFAEQVAEHPDRGK